MATRYQVLRANDLTDMFIMFVFVFIFGFIFGFCLGFFCYSFLGM